MPIARDGWPYILTLLALALVALALRYFWAGGVLVFLGLFASYFFRDPERSIPGDPRLVLSPADGKVILVRPAPEDGPLGPGAQQVSIFLSIFDVHVNRAPVGGQISHVAYHPGQFLPAWNDKASLRNEQNVVTIEQGEQRVAFKQIAGLVARRIVFRKRQGDLVQPGERVGMIKFGSRVDVFVPASVRLRVEPGDRVAGGVSVLGERP